MTSDMQLIQEPVVTAALSLLAPRSTCTVRLASADQAQPPIADPRYLTHPDDRATMRAGLHLLKRIFDSKALSAVTAAPIEPTSWTDEALDSWIRSNAGTEWHPAGTCAMGTGEQAVVDPAPDGGPRLRQRVCRRLLRHANRHQGKSARAGDHAGRTHGATRPERAGA
jgi:choline dehydrogenase